MDEKKKTREEWDAEFEAFLEKGGLDEEAKKDMRRVREFIGGLLNEEQWALDLSKKALKEMNRLVA